MTEKYQVVTTKSGQRISCGFFGDGSLETPIFYFHGFPGSLEEAGVTDLPAKREGVTVIAVERPGFGDSPIDCTHSIIRWAAIVNELADYFQLKKFGILSVSGGTPYALSCAAQLSDRITVVGIVSGVGPYTSEISLTDMTALNRLLLYLSAEFPPLARGLGMVTAKVWKNFPQLMIWWFRQILVGDDLAMLSNLEVQDLLCRNLKRALKTGVRGAAHELVMMGNPWGFDLESISAPVLLWHGTEDRYVPIQFSRFVVSKLQHGTLTEVSGGGHFMVVDLIGDVLRQMKARVEIK